MDFYQFRTRETKNGVTELYPGFRVGRSTDLMVRGGKFYAIWDQEKGLWSTDEYDVARLVDAELMAHAAEAEKKGVHYLVKSMRDFESNSWSIFQKYVNQVSDNSTQLDQTLTFANSEVKKSDYASKRLNYALEAGECPAWDELVGTLYSVEERAKIEWAIGAVVSGDSRKIQKFLVFYGAPGSGKGTILDIVAKLFKGYTTFFDAKALGGNANQFATEVFKNDPLVAIQGDGDLSNIQDNAKLNSIISHENMVMNEKFKSAYTAAVLAFLFMGTNKPVRISDAKSGIIRRLIDVHPSGAQIPVNHYLTLVGQVDFELGAIAHRCLSVYKEMGKNYYSAYRPLEMMLQTDPFFNFIEYNFDTFRDQDGVSLTQAYAMYKQYCQDSNIDKPMHRQKFQFELRNYFDEFKDRAEVDGHQVRSYYSGFNANKFKAPSNNTATYKLVLDETTSLLDDQWANLPAQYASRWETPKKKWNDTFDDEGKLIQEGVKTVLGELDTSELHFVKVPDRHIVIDFDLKDEDGNKSLELNLEAASVWPGTYAELSKSGEGVHLHYKYDGDTSLLSPIYSEGIEVKVYTGDASLRRRLSKCNAWPISTLGDVLPKREKPKMLEEKTLKNEKMLRAMIEKNLRKEYHPHTKSSVDFIKKLLDEAFAGDFDYDVSDMKGKIFTFAQGSKNQALQSMKLVQEMRFSSAERTEVIPNDPFPRKRKPTDDRIVFYDVEVYPNLFVICWKYAGAADTVVMINPTPQECEALLNFKLVGFYNRRYDNHILYARILGYTNHQLFKLSQRMIVENDRNATFGEAYGLSYADIWDFSSVKESLKKFMIMLGLPHMEMDIPWDQPVPDHMIEKVVEYCKNDVLGTEGVFNARRQDFVARQILADISGLTVNDTTQRHTAKIIFGDDRHPQASFVYTKLKDEFPGYHFDPYAKDKSTYKGEVAGEGGYVYAEPGMYNDVAILDVASMHPTSIVQLNLFGEYTPNFKALLDARLAIKREDYDTAREMLDGKLAPYLEHTADADALSYALKIVINIVYGLTSAKFDNPFRDIRNVDNIVAKRGALFMIDLKEYVQSLGCQVVHIKTDSIKIPGASQEVIDEVMRFGEKYGYDFEHEATYDRMCLVNDAVYIAKYGWAAKAKLIGTWYAVGAQFQHPFVYKQLFSHEDIQFDDLCETKQVVKGAMYLDFHHDNPEVAPAEGMKFVGRTGRFTPVQEGQGGGMLYRMMDGKPYSVQGTKGHLWMESELALSTGAAIDMSYFEKLADKAADTIWKFGNYDEFVK